MTRILPIFALATALAAPLTALADTPRASSPARQMLYQMMVDMPAYRGGRHRSPVVGDWVPRAVHTPRFGLIGLPSGPGTWFSIRHDGHLSFSVGCNRYWAQARIAYGRIDVGRISGTRMACPDRQSAAERRVIRALRNAVRIETWRGQVRFMDLHGLSWLVLDSPGLRTRRYHP
jgi:hypothetical protein